MIEPRVRELLQAEAAALPAPPAPTAAPARRRPRPLLAVAVAAAVVLFAVGGAALLLRRGDSPRLPADVALAEGPVAWSTVDLRLRGHTAGALAHGPAGFVLATGGRTPGGEGAVAVSADGEQWEVAPVEAFRGYRIVDMAAGGAAGYLAVGVLVEAGSASDSGVAVFRSPDGVEWSATPLPAPPGTGHVDVVIRDVAAAGDVAAVNGELLFEESVAGGPAPTSVLWRSTDGGRSWDLADTSAFPTGDVVAAIGAGPAGLVAAVGSPRRVTAWRSPDGDAWAEVSEQLGLVERLAGNPGGYVLMITESGDSQAWWSADGARWERTLSLGGGFLTWLEASPGGFVAGRAADPANPEQPDFAALEYALHYSPDGIAWRSVAGFGDLPPGFVPSSGVAVGGGRIVAAGLAGTPAPEGGPVAVVGTVASP